jgi:dienelactone hydrolase
MWFSKKSSALMSVVAMLLLACAPAASDDSGNGAVEAIGAESANSPPADIESARASQAGLPSAEEIALFDYEASVPLEIVEHGREQLDGLERIDVTYGSPHGGQVPAWVYEPDHEGPHAGLVLMHGMPGSRDTAADLAASYARSGAVVIAISAPFARRGGSIRDQTVSLTEEDRADQIQLIVDLRRAVDYLLTHPAVDPDRIGYVGASYGGAMGGLLAGVERRIVAYVLVVGDGGLVAHFSGPEDRISGAIGEERWQAWLEAMEPIEPIRFVGLAAPTPLLFQNARADRMVPVADAERYQQAANEPKTVLWYDTGHTRTPEMIRDQAEWLAQHIGIDPERFAR